jgi:diacylglycerol kinase family enzyme
MRVLAIINARAGTADAQDETELREQLSALFQARGIEAEIELVEGEQIPEAARRAAESAKAGKIDAVVVGGGDGTIRGVAEELADTGIALGILPLGTRNHFAKELGIAGLEAAVDAIASGRTASIDAAEVNGRLFINNSSVGLYPFLVQDRERRQDEHGLAKWIAAALASLRMIWRFPVRRLSLKVEGSATPLRTPLLFVGNNEYCLDAESFGARQRLNGGKLWICVSKRQSRLGLLLLALRAVLGFSNPARDFASMRVQSAEIDSRASRIPVALDGEAEIMRSPLHYRTRPGALRLFVPEAGEEDEAALRGK